MWCWETSEHKDGGGGVGGLKRGKTTMELATREHDKVMEPGGVPGSIKDHLRLVISLYVKSVSMFGCFFWPCLGVCLVMLLGYQYLTDRVEI